MIPRVGSVLFALARARLRLAPSRARQTLRAGGGRPRSGRHAGRTRGRQLTASTSPGWTARSRPGTTSSSTPTAPGSSRPRSPPTRAAGGRSTSSREQSLAAAAASAARGGGQREPLPPAPRSASSATSTRATSTRRTVEARGLEPLRPQLAAIAQLRDRTALSRALGADLRTDVDALNATHFHTSRLFGFWVAPDLNQPAVYTGYLFQGGLGMPDREYYLSTNPKMAATRDALPGPRRAGARSSPASRAPRRRPPASSTSRPGWRGCTPAAPSRSRCGTPAPWKRTEFGRRAPGLDWTAFFAAAGLRAAAHGGGLAAGGHHGPRRRWSSRSRSPPGRTG